jgi:hypothetical protein
MRQKAMRPTEPPPIVLDTPPLSRLNRAVPRPWPVNIALAFLWFYNTAAWVSFHFSLTLSGSIFAPMLGIDPSTFLAWFYISLIFWPVFNFLRVWFLAIMFDSFTEYGTQIITEGTARALAKQR